jgi:hypothetical protein
MRVVAVIASVLVLVACARQEDKPIASAAEPAAPAPARPHADFIPTQAQVDRFLAEGPDPTLRKISVADYWLHYKLMQATGIEKELGGEAQAIAALKALGEAYERKLRIAEVDVPKMIPTAFTGEGMGSGFVGMGMGSFVGFVTGGMTSGAISRMSDKELADLSAAGAIKHEGGGGTAELQIGKDGSLSQSMEFDVNEHGLNGKVKMKIKMGACPDADGKVTVDIEVDSQMSVSGKPGTGGHVQTKFKYERYLDDDAHLIDTGDGGASNLRVRMGGYENFESQSVDLTVGHERGGKPIFEHHDEHGFSIFRPEEVERTQELLRATELLQTLMAEVMLRGGMGSGGSPWESGRCIDLKVSSDPGKRKGVRPSTAFDLEAKPRAKEGGATVGGTVTATLNGGSSLQPASGKEKVDAKYGYTGPEKKDEVASVAFEARSKRGVGRATLDFDTKTGRPYSMEGGAGDFHGVGQVCDLEQPFTVEGGGNTVRFAPSSREGGKYTYSGNMAGFGVHGYGTYTVKYADDVAVSITAKGPGTVETPRGPQTGEGTEQYTLTPLGETDCGES